VLQPVGLSGVAANLNSIKLQNIGSMPNTDIIQLGLYSDKVGSGNLGKFDPEDFQNGPPTDIFIASATYSGADNSWNFTNLNALNAVETNVTSTKRYFVTIRISSTATPNSTLGFQILQSNSILLTGASGAVIARNNFTMRSATTTVDR